MLELAGGSMIRGSARFLFGLAYGSVICALQNPSMVAFAENGERQASSYNTIS